MGKFSALDSRGIPVAVLAVACLGVGFWVGRATSKGSAENAPVSSGGAAASSSAGSKKPGGPPAAPPKPAAPAGPLEFEAMEFDTSPDFSHPSTTFLPVPRIYFRIRLKDHRENFKGAAKKPSVSYQRLGATAAKNGPLRMLAEQDLHKEPKTGEVIASRDGLTFMGGPPAGKTSFQVFVDNMPVGQGAFTIQSAKPSAKP